MKVAVASGRFEHLDRAINAIVEVAQKFEVVA
jgi:hypothetical protein